MVIRIGSVAIGGGNPIAVQSMAKTDTSDVKATVRQIKRLEWAGCEIVRVAVKDAGDAKAVKKIKKEIAIPLVADIHFSPSLALLAIENGADKIRINPGNITSKKDILRIMDAAEAASVPIRAGVNSGSLPVSYKGSDRTKAMVKLAEDFILLCRERNFHEVALSLKDADVARTVDAYRKISVFTDAPLHLGVTAAGLPEDGIISSSIGIGSLLLDGIGDTIRVSLTGDPVTEVETAKRILSSLGLRSFGPRIIACPTCGRCRVDLVRIAREIRNKLKRHTTCDIRRTKIAVMGCEVNGPGEAKEADMGIAFGRGRGAIFVKGKIVKTVAERRAVEEMLKMVGRR